MSLNANVYSSFLATEEIRTVSGTLGLQDDPQYRFTIRFDQKRSEGGGTVDILKIVRIKSDEAEVLEFPNDKLGDLTKAFVSAVHGNTPDPRLATVHQAGALVRIADAILQSDQKDGQPVHVQLD